jgi:5-methylcytosine-specific restriction endonuclease McrBC GTP-binding regulatory subunit McrB
VQNNGEKLLLPPNLNILATMNTSDQSLFPMDSAFKRRWDWEYLPINYESTYIDHLGEVKENESYTYRVEISNNQTVSWLEFIKAVNGLIKSNDNLGMDKCIGNYFIKSQDAIIDLETFINKAIFYLWNDVFKDELDEYSIFKNKTTYEDFFPIQTLGVEKVSELMDILQVEITSKSE